MAKDRQFGKSVKNIQKDHVERYRFSATGISGRVLDAACGCGYGSHILSEKAAAVVGVDIEPKAVEWAREHFDGPTYICGDLLNAPWYGHFDYVVSLETVEHLPDPVGVLKLFRHSADKLIVSVPNQVLQPFSAAQFAGDDYPHLRHYTPEELDATLEECGWKVLSRFCQESKSNWPVKQGVDGKTLLYICA